MPPTTPTDPAMCSLCPRSKKAHHPKKFVRFDSIVDTFSISDSNAATNEREPALIACTRLLTSHASRKKHPRVRFLSAIFTTFLSVRHECGARYIYARGINDDYASPPDLAKTSLRKKRAREMQYLRISALSSKNSLTS
ncbi:Uncharacterized protein DBV15_02369 [Temnothorax longispinosus]|uniref:Uncharacterized protein n=1 Tax=Temnothorax longispinosus TaxID=300112 RepID=A0A4S2JRQ6_9HYME|nr:Uncharacterized protein DBV15_02369 [Temnothorax longispinosus]